MTANVASDPTILELEERLGKGRVPAAVTEAVRRALATLATTADVMAWEVLPLDLFGPTPEGIRSAWIFAIRGGSRTGPDRSGIRTATSGPFPWSKAAASSFALPRAGSRTHSGVRRRRPSRNDG